MTSFADPVVAWRGATGPQAPLVVLLHGRGSNEADIASLADVLPAHAAYAALPAPTTRGRLDGLPVLVIHGDQDAVIPRELLDRTWRCLQDDAAADVTAVRDPGGHGLSPAGLGSVERWLQAILDGPEAST